jgi:LmbE family N-acetylglucosaminyl deacetylase
MRALLSAALLSILAGTAHAQARGAAAIAQGVYGFGTTARVLMVGAHPDDEDTGLITWLALGRQVETAYLSLTRGDGGQNLIGNELGEALGAIRTEELLAARRIDGGHQYFTRAYDFGFSKDSAETLKHWPREETLGDVVRVVRAFRPHVIVSVWSGTAADGHGHHTVAGILARDAYDAAADTVRFPTNTFGAAWAPDKFYRTRRGAAGGAAVRMNVGEFNTVLGRSYGDIATESRSQHKSQGQGRISQGGVQWDYVRREATRVNANTDAAQESSMFDGIDTSWTRFASSATTAAQRAVIDSVPLVARAARAALDLRAPGAVVPLLARAAGLIERARNESQCRYAAVALACTRRANDFGASIEEAHRRVTAAVLAAAGLDVGAYSDREYLALGDTGTVTVSVVNRGATAVTLRGADLPGAIGLRDTTSVVVAVDSAATASRKVRGLLPGGASWWVGDRVGNDLFPEVPWPADGARGTRSSSQVPSVSGVAVAEDDRLTSWVDVRFEIAGAVFTHRVGPIVQRKADAVAGEVRRPLVPVNAVSLLFDRAFELMRANEPIDRIIRLRVRSYSTQPRFVKFQFKIPDGLRTDKLPDTTTLAPLEIRDVPIHVRGSVPAGKFPLTAGATDGGVNFYGTGLFTLEYEHIRPIVMSRNTGLWVQGVVVAIPTGVRVGYIPGVSDDVGPVLQQLDVPVTTIEPDKVMSTDLKQFQIVVVGPRAYTRTPVLVAFNERLEQFARDGGTVVVQYGQQEMTRKGMLPFPIELAQQAQRVTLEDAPVRVVDSTARVLNAPNRLTNADFDDWVQERSLYMPSRADSAWKTVLEMNDPGEPANRNSLLVARLGAGTYVYTTLSLFRQLPAGNAGAIRLFMNLLSAGLRPSQ